MTPTEAWSRPNGKWGMKACAAPGCEQPVAVRVKTVPLCDVHAQAVMASAAIQGTRVIELVRQQVEATLALEPVAAVGKR